MYGRSKMGGVGRVEERFEVVFLEMWVFCGFVIGVFFGVGRINLFFFLVKGYGF